MEPYTEVRMKGEDPKTVKSNGRLADELVKAQMTIRQLTKDVERLVNRANHLKSALHRASTDRDYLRAQLEYHQGEADKYHVEVFKLNKALRKRNKQVKWLRARLDGSNTAIPPTS